MRIFQKSKPRLRYDHVVHIAQKHKAADFLKIVYEDMNKYGITSVDTPKNKHSRHYSSSSRKRKSKQSNSMRDKSDSPVVVIPFDVSNGKSIQRGFAKGDLSINHLLEDLAYVVNQNKHKGEGLYSGEEDEEYSNSEEDSSGEFSDDSDDGSGREDDTSDSDSDAEK